MPFGDASAPGTTDRSQPYNVLLITADQWRADCLSCRGHPTVRTPCLDKFAADATSFLNHYSNAAPCAPARACLHTGMYLRNHRVVSNGTPLDARHTNWALELRKAGYLPALLGYTDTANDPRNFPPGDPMLRHCDGPLPGFTPVLEWTGMGDACEVWAEHLREMGYEIPATAFVSEDLHLDPGNIDWSTALPPGLDAEEAAAAPCPPPAFYKAEHSDSAFLVGEARRYIQRRRRAPWALHLSLLRPHPPWVAPAPYNTMYPPHSLAPPASFDPRREAQVHPWLGEVHQNGTGITVEPAEAFSMPEIQRMRSQYFALVSETDAHIGTLLSFLEDSGELEKTLIIITSDHGEMLGDHALLYKGGFYDEAYHVPLMIRDPSPHAAQSRGRLVSAFTEAVDIMPTILERLSLPIPASCDGASLLPFLEGAGAIPQGWRQFAHFEAQITHAMKTIEMERRLGLASPHEGCLMVLRGTELKYVHFGGGLPPLLFNVRLDPHEKENVVQNPEYTSATLYCAQQLLTWLLGHACDRTFSSTLLTTDGIYKRETTDRDQDTTNDSFVFDISPSLT